MKSLLIATTLINASGAFTISHNVEARLKYSQLTMSTESVETINEKPIDDPMGLYPKSSIENKDDKILFQEGSDEIICDERKVRDPMGLYPNGMLKEQDLEAEALETSKQNPIRDPLGLYPKDASERVDGVIEPLEPVLQGDGSVKDPLNLYSNKEEIDTSTKMSASLPFLVRPKLLDGSLPGDRGFDPLNFASDAGKLEWYRSAEIKHARLAMLAAVGWPISEIMDEKLADAFNLQPLVDLEDRVPSVLNGGLSETPLAFWILAFVATTAIEMTDILKNNSAKNDGSMYTPGDLGFDPLNLGGNSKEEMFEKQEAEIFNGRLSMLAVSWFALQEWWTHNAVIHETPLFFKPFFLG